MKEPKATAGLGLEGVKINKLSAARQEGCEPGEGSVRDANGGKSLLEEEVGDCVKGCAEDNDGQVSEVSSKEVVGDFN